MNKSCIFLTLSFMLFCFTIQLHAATFYVSMDGSDSAPGTKTSPWMSLQHAAGCAFYMLITDMNVADIGLGCGN